MAIVRFPFKAFARLLQTLVGIRTIIGYHDSNATDISSLPRLRKGILTPVVTLNHKQEDNEIQGKHNMLYAKDYKTTNDLQLLWKGFRKMGS